MAIKRIPSFPYGSIIQGRNLQWRHSLYYFLLFLPLQAVILYTYVHDSADLYTYRFFHLLSALTLPGISALTSSFFHRWQMLPRTPSASMLVLTLPYLMCIFFSAVLIKEGGFFKSWHFGGCSETRTAAACAGSTENCLNILLLFSLQA